MRGGVGVLSVRFSALPGEGLRRDGAVGGPSAARRIHTGFAQLDLLLGGGLPRGLITQVVGAPSSGRTTFAYAVLEAATAEGEYAAWVDLPDAFDAEHAAAAGIDLSHLLWVRPRRFKEALGATELILGTSGFAVVLVDLGEERVAYVPSPAAWLRLARGAAHSRTAVVILGVPHWAGMFVPLCLETERRQSRFSGRKEPFPMFEGIVGAVHLRKNKFGPPGGVAERFMTTLVL